MISLRAPSRAETTTALAVVVIVAAVAGVVLSFSQQVGLARENRIEIARLERAIDDIETRNRDLAERLEYVQSDEYVEQWARESMKMGRPDEIVVIPVAESDEVAASVPQRGPSPEAEVRPFWVEAWELIVNPTGE